MERLDRLTGWLMFAVGLLHCSVTFIIAASPTETAFWFFSGGLALIYCAALNLLRVRYAAMAPGLRRVCAAVNVSMLAFIFAYLAAQRAFRNPGAVVVTASALAATAFSLFRRPSAQAGTS